MLHWIDGCSLGVIVVVHLVIEKGTTTTTTSSCTSHLLYIIMVLTGLSLISFVVRLLLYACYQVRDVDRASTKAGDLLLANGTTSLFRELIGISPSCYHFGLYI